VVLSAFQEAERFTAATHRRYQRLAASAAFVAALGGDGPDLERRFDFCLTYDRELVIEAASALRRRVTPLS
jgi:hypothetical protein